MGAAQLLGHLGEGEPLRDLPAVGQAGPQFGAGDRRVLALGDLVLGDVAVLVGQVDHHLEGDHAHAQLGLVTGHQLLGVVGPVERLAAGVAARAGVVSSDDQVGAAVVLADDGVPHRLTGAAEAHRQREQGQLGGVVRVAVHDRLVGPHPGVVVHIARLGHADHRVDQQVGLDQLGGAHGELQVGPVHGVARLEGGHPAPAAAGEALAQFGRGVAQGLVVVVMGQGEAFEAPAAYQGLVAPSRWFTAGCSRLVVPKTVSASCSRSACHRSST